MPLLNVSPPAGVVKNGTALQQANTWSDANLVRWYEGAMQPIGGWRKRTTAAMDGVCRAIISYLDNGRNRRTVAGTHTKLYFVGEDNTLTDVTPSGFTTGNANAVQNLGYGGLTWNASTWNTPRPDSGAYTPATTWSLDTFGEYVIACATSDGKIYQWANSTGTPAALLSNAPTSTTAIVVSEERFVFALGAGGVGNKVAFSDQEQSNVWAPAATNQAGSFTLATNGNLMAGVRMRGETLLLTDIDAHTARYQGPPFVYGFRQAGTGCGVISANGCAVADGTAYWMGNNGFYMYNGSVQSMRSSVGDFIFSHLNTTERSKVFAVVNSQFSEVVWFYPSAGTTENDSYVSYNYRENHWQIGKVARTAGFDIGAFVFPNYVSSEATGSYVYEHEVGNTYDTDSDVFAETGPMQIGVGDRMMVATSLIPDEQTQGDVTATFKTRTYPNSAESSFGPFDMANPTSVRFQGRQVQMRVTGDQPTSWRVGNMRLEVVAGSRR
jgi:hypothetical protein